MHKIFVNRNPERSLFEKMIKGDTSIRAVDIRCGVGTGKSDLLYQFYQDAGGNNLPRCLIRFSTKWGGTSIEVMRHIVHQLIDGTHNISGQRPFEEFLRQDAVLHNQSPSNYTDAQPNNVSLTGQFSGATLHNISGRDIYDITIQQYRQPSEAELKHIEQNLTHLFLKDIREFATVSPLVVLFDNMESISFEVSRWLSNTLLHILKNGMSKQLILIMAGHAAGNRPTFSLNEQGTWLKCVENLSLFDVIHVKEYLNALEIILEDTQYELIHRGIKSNPLALALWALTVRGDMDTWT